MKYLSIVGMIFFTVAAAANNNKLDCDPISVSVTLTPMEQACSKALKDQVTVELGAAIAYLRMAAHFSTDSINRPGFAKFFFESASEEREHAIKFIHYLLMRGELTADIHSLIHNPYANSNKDAEWESGVRALKDALDLEKSVTENITNIIVVCEEPFKKNETKCNAFESEDERKKCDDAEELRVTKANDYHLVDYLTGEFLEEQYKGQRDLAGKIATLEKMRHAYGNLGEFLFDKKLLDQDISPLF